MTRSSRTTLQPLFEHLRCQLQEAERRQRDEEAEYFRLAYEWWTAQDLVLALERRNEAA